MIVNERRSDANQTAVAQARQESVVGGNKFSSVSQSSAITNAMEELSISLSQNKKRKSVHVQADKLIQSKDQLEKYIANSVELNKDGIYEKMLGEAKDADFKTRHQLLKFVSSSIKDPGNQFLFLEKFKMDLQAMLATAESEQAGEDITKALNNKIAMADKALGMLLIKNPTKLLASLNVSNIVYKFVDISPTKDVQTMLSFYYNAVVGYKNLTAVLEYIQTNFEAEFFFDSINFLLESTAADLSSPAISMDQIKLRVINQDIYKMRALKDLYKSFHKNLIYFRRKEENE